MSRKARVCLLTAGRKPVSAVAFSRQLLAVAEGVVEVQSEVERERERERERDKVTRFTETIFERNGCCSLC